jgi:riboflavin synthase
MFTGLVQTLAKVQAAAPDGHGGTALAVREPQWAPALTLGESLCVNGACLTVVAMDAETFSFQVGPETLKLTNLGSLHAGHAVNLERSLAVGDRLGGHFVTGHIDGMGHVLKRETQGEWEMVEFGFDPHFDDLIVKKGSIAVDGVSLTVAECSSGRFTVMLIPHTLHATTLGTKAAGDTVNLEFDLLAKHVRKMLKNMTVTI